jgi:predicted double-glycine peptidase
MYRWNSSTLLLVSAVVALAASPWLDVPFVRQRANGCGSASLAMVIGYWERQGFSIGANTSDEAVIFRELYSRESEGIKARAMRDYLERLGFHAFAYQGDWKDLSEQLTKGRPVIVGLGEPGGDSRHYVVVAGVAGNIAWLNDPADRKLRKIRRDRFERRWSATHNWTLLAVPNQPSR